MIDAFQSAIYISTHAPAGGATPTGSARLLQRSPFLLTPLREGRLPQLDAAGEIGIISTHAPAGGATQDYHRYPRHRPISTHAPAGGATRISTASNCWSTYFYSRPCGRGDCCPFLRRPPCRRFLLTPLREGRRHTALRRGLADFISTHAPAGGATRRDGRPQPAARHFYSRPCGRGDPAGRKIGSLHAIFLLTPLREGRRHTEVDHTYQSVISTHAPAGGATYRFAGKSECCSYFYSRPCGRGDRKSRTSSSSAV